MSPLQHDPCPMPQRPRMTIMTRRSSCPIVPGFISPSGVLATRRDARATGTGVRSRRRLPTEGTAAAAQRSDRVVKVLKAKKRWLRDNTSSHRCACSRGCSRSRSASVVRENSTNTSAGCKARNEGAVSIRYRDSGGLRGGVEREGGSGTPGPNAV